MMHAHVHEEINDTVSSAMIGKRMRGLRLIPCVVMCAIAAPVCAQRFVSQPPVDASAQASPLASAPRAAAVDASIQASPMIGPPVSYTPVRGSTVAAGTEIEVALDHAIDSGHLKNGQNVEARLIAPVRLESGEVLRAGTPVTINVIETLAAGVLAAEGEFSLQAQQVGRVDLFTNTETFRGKPGPRDVADAAPALGTDAGLPAGARLTFRVLAEPVAVSGPPEETALTPGSVDGVAVGGPPPPGSRTNSGEPMFGGRRPSEPHGNARIVPGANNTFAPAQHLGEPSAAPNQIAPTHSGPQAEQGATTAPR